MLHENCMKITVQQSLPFSYINGKCAYVTCRYQTHQIHVTANVRLIETHVGPQVFWGSGENGYLFSGSWGALVIILGELGSKLIILGI